MLSHGEKAAIEAFAERATLAADVLRKLVDQPPNLDFDEASLACALGLPPSQEAGVLEVLRTAQRLGFVGGPTGLRWNTAVSSEALIRVASLLDAIGYYRERVHRDSTSVKVVLTKPAKPSRLEAELEGFGWKVAELESTTEAFLGLASSASERIVVMTPFLDLAGAEWLVRLLERAPARVSRIVVLRHLSDPSHPSYPTGYSEIRSRLKELSTKVFDYSLPRIGGPGLETFHAKVVVRDHTHVYVGSSNMNKASLDYSMELGVLLTGEAATEVTRIIDAILSVASPTTL